MVNRNVRKALLFGALNISIVALEGKPALALGSIESDPIDSLTSWLTLAQLDGKVAAIVTRESMQSLGIKKGVRACALIKASHIILAVTG